MAFTTSRINAIAYTITNSCMRPFASDVKILSRGKLSRSVKIRFSRVSGLYIDTVRALFMYPHSRMLIDTDDIFEAPIKGTLEPKRGPKTISS